VPDLPDWLTVAKQGAGVWRFSGNPTEPSAPVTLRLTASNGIGPDAVRDISVGAYLDPPTITSPARAVFAVGVPREFTITTRGFPISLIRVDAGNLPDGLTFADNHDDTATGVLGGGVHERIDSELYRGGRRQLPDHDERIPEAVDSSRDEPTTGPSQLSRSRDGSRSATVSSAVRLGFAAHSWPAWSDQSAAGCSAYPCCRTRMALPKGSRRPMSVP
jgi:hypothetical protein